jgi:putative membrane protein
MGFFGTSATFFSDISLILEAIILGSFIVGIRYARRHLSNQHYKIMTAGFVLNVIFVGSYMIRSLLSEDSVRFSGPEVVKTLVYLPTVIVHGIASLGAFALAGYTVYYGFTHTVQKKRRVFTDSGLRTRHRLLGILAVSTWTLSFATGVLVYLLLYVFYPTQI